MRTFHETPATESQFKSRALMSSFVVAASTAVSCFGVSTITIKNIYQVGFEFQLTFILFLPFRQM